MQIAQLIGGIAVLLNVLVHGSIVNVKGRESTPCSAIETFLKDLQTLLTAYLGEAQITDESHSFHSARQTSGGAVYTRWGRTVCPPGNDMVYKGYAGGSHYNYQGGSANRLCLPERPIYANYTSGYQSGSYVYGAEYESIQTSPNVKQLINHDVPCIVCRSRGQRTVIMVPARNKCHPGWRLEYWGYLMGGNYDHKATADYVCVDVEAEKVVGGQKSLNGNLFYLSESVCGSLPCPPYHNGWELTCAVCSKK